MNSGFIGIIGSGSFGMTIAKLLAEQNSVLVYSRKPEIVEEINGQHRSNGFRLSPKIRATSNIADFTSSCRVIFPVVPSSSFRTMMKSFSPHLKPYHILIHATKGFDLMMSTHESIKKMSVFTMSEVIMQESSVLKIGCLAGPNLAVEILEEKPTATVVASQFKEVIEIGQKLLASSKFFVFGSYDLKGSELAGALKNIVALGTGILDGRKMGKNIQAMMITRGLSEMIHLGKAMGAKTRSFLGTSGIGDLVATATSKDSRNFSMGYRIGSGERLSDMDQQEIDVAEGLRTLKIMYFLSKEKNIAVPVTTMLYLVIYEEFEVEKAIKYLMNYPYGIDVDFLEIPDEGI